MTAGFSCKNILDLSATAKRSGSVERCEKITVPLPRNCGKVRDAWKRLCKKGPRSKPQQQLPPWNYPQSSVRQSRLAGETCTTIVQISRIYATSCNWDRTVPTTTFSPRCKRQRMRSENGTIGKNWFQWLVRS